MSRSSASKQREWTPITIYVGLPSPVNEQPSNIEVVLIQPGVAEIQSKDTKNTSKHWIMIPDLSQFVLSVDDHQINLTESGVKFGKGRELYTPDNHAFQKWQKRACCWENVNAVLERMTQLSTQHGGFSRLPRRFTFDSLVHAPVSTMVVKTIPVYQSNEQRVVNIYAMPPGISTLDCNSRLQELQNQKMPMVQFENVRCANDDCTVIAQIIDTALVQSFWSIIRKLACDDVHVIASLNRRPDGHGGLTEGCWKSDGKTVIELNKAQHSIQGPRTMRNWMLLPCIRSRNVHELTMFIVRLIANMLRRAHSNYITLGKSQFTLRNIGFHFEERCLESLEPTRAYAYLMLPMPTLCSEDSEHKFSLKNHLHDKSGCFADCMKEDYEQLKRLQTRIQTAFVSMGFCGTSSIGDSDTFTVDKVIARNNVKSEVDKLATLLNTFTSATYTAIQDDNDLDDDTKKKRLKYLNKLYNSTYRFIKFVRGICDTDHPVNVATDDITTAINGVANVLRRNGNTDLENMYRAIHKIVCDYL